MTKFIYNLWDITTDLAPWLLFGLFLAGLLHILLPSSFVRKHLGHGGIGSIIKAVAIGVPMPLCSCGVIPTAIGLKKDGASDGAAIGFLISTPQTGLDSIFVSAGFLGWPFAIFKVLSAFVTGLIGGLLVSYFGNKSQGNAEESCDSENKSCCIGKNQEEAKEEEIKPKIEKEQSKFSEMVRFSLMLLSGIYVWLVVGVILAAVITTALPEGKLSEFGWTSGITGMLAMLAISLPMYICATSSVPLAASLVMAGMPAGSALVLLMAGPATNLATIGAIAKAFGKKVTAIYVLTVAVMSILLGLGFEKVIQVGSEHMGHNHNTLPHWLQVAAAVVLITLLVWIAFGDLKNKFEKKTEPQINSDEH